MRYRILDANGDMTFGHSSANFYVNTPAAVAQAVRTRLLLFTGEWFLDILDGLPWRTQVLGKFSQQGYDTVIKQRILGTQGVKQLISYNSVLNTVKRSLAVTATIDTIYGVTTLGQNSATSQNLNGLLNSTFILDLSTLA